MSFVNNAVMTPCRTEMCKWVSENTRGTYLLYGISFRCGPVARTKWIAETTKQLTRSADFAELQLDFPRFV